MAEAPGADAVFLRLQARFVAGLAGRWQAIEAAGSDRVALHAELHRLAGVAGGYGFEALGRAARAAMHATGVDAGEPPDEDLDARLAVVRGLIDGLQGAAGA